MRSWKYILPLLASTLCFAAQPDRISGVIDSSQKIALARSLHPKAQPQYDQGSVAPSLKLGYITLVTMPSPSQQAALDQLLAAQQNPKSPSYHKWLTPAQYADSFGLTQNDINKITAWLKAEGFAVQSVGGGRNTVIFSGTAGQVQSAFATEIHSYRVGGKNHIANSSPVMIPAALSGIVRNVMGLHNFLPHPVNHGRASGAAGKLRPGYYDAEFQANFLAPGDVATIYNIAPLYNAATPIDGTGQTLAIIGQTDVYLADINDFRAGFGLNQITGCTTNSLGIITACNSTNFQYVAVTSDPGTTYPCGDLGEADLDIEWSGAVARNAQIIFVNSPVEYFSNSESDCNYPNGTGYGVNVALTAAINPPSGPPLAPVISMSYGQCELNAEDLETVLQQGNAEGVTILNSSDDIGAAGCDFNPPNNNQPFSGAVGGLAVSYPASSPEVTGVGGSEISITNDSAGSGFWGTSNPTNGGTATSYIPEIPWNDDLELAQFCQSDPSNLFCLQGGSPAVEGWVALTSTATAQQVQEDIWISIGGGGASNCWDETSGGVCTSGFPQPSYQSALNVNLAPAGVRYVPDVSFMASPNFPGYIYCTPLDAPTNTTSTCADGIADAIDDNNSLVGGTSVSSPVFAGIVTLLNQYLNGPSSPGLGNINTMLYSLAATPSNGVFHQITTGSNDVYCQAGQPSNQPVALQCPTTGVAVLGYSAANADSATGYNLVAGLGSVNADVLFTTLGAARASTTTAISPPSANVNEGASITFTATVTPSTATGTVSFYNNGSTTALGTASLVSGTATFSTTALPPGTDNVTATYNGNESANSGVGGGLNVSTSTPAAVTVTAADFSITAGSLFPSSSVPAGQSASVTLTITPVTGAGTVNFTPGSCSNLPSGAACSFNPSSVTFGGVGGSGMTTLTISTSAIMLPPQGAQAITITGTNGSATHTAQVSLTITATTESYTIAVTNNTSSFSATAGGTASVPITVSSSTGFINTSSNTTNYPLSYTCTGFPFESTCTFSPSSGSSVSVTTLTMNIVTTAPTTQLRPPLGRGSRIFYALMLPGLFGIVLASGSRFRGARLLGLIVVLGFSTLWLSSCSGGSNSSQNNPGTTPGTYSVVVNSTTGGTNPLTGTFTVSLTVTQ
jgi:subtilase family serine protease